GEQFRLIVNGRPAEEAEFPWQVSIQNFGLTQNLRYGWTHICGGAILSRDWIITAAHCNSNRTTQIKVGTLNWRDENASTHEIIERVLHPDDHDIMLMKVNPSFSFSRFIQPVCLPQPNKEYIGYATVAGWGSLSDDGDDDFHYPEQLHSVDLPLIPQELCQAYQKERFNSSTMICAGKIEELIPFGACYVADSGGGLVAYLKQKFLLLGIVSKQNGNYPCGMPKNPGIYIKVASFFEWIVETIARDMLKKLKNKINNEKRCQEMNNSQKTIEADIFANEDDEEIVQKFNLFVRNKANEKIFNKKSSDPYIYSQEDVKNTFLSAIIPSINKPQFIPVASSAQMPSLMLTQFSNQPQSSTYTTKEISDIKPKFKIKLAIRGPNMERPTASPTLEDYYDESDHESSQSHHYIRPHFLFKASVHNPPKKELEKAIWLKYPPPAYCFEPLLIVDSCEEQKVEKRWTFNPEDNKCYLYYDFCPNERDENSFKHLTECISICWRPSLPVR
ncbi:Trypsin-1-like protein, partial [Dinothrombium tinctorium]